ncbi:uncharacterized protein EHS24_004756 [Apiotrichum porosum]|uniref:Zn(2)-C6 fungal-type domain-containing protein n=1 Tax=Apiotrichum porosum TaxID=105984 RepID=A0A427Y5X5_9TREE|nr:uncharacterized protein EHS24_004756 [Apiotrichum porosum]RSH86499.1 hypothetical protein EHS24_004756 [Apiotrichum porosum]
MNDLYATSVRPAVGGNGLAAPPGARAPGTLQPSNRQGQLGGPGPQQHPDGDYRLAPSYQAPSGSWQTGGGFPPQPMMMPGGGGNVYNQQQAAAAAVAAAQQSLQGYPGPAGRGQAPQQDNSTNPRSYYPPPPGGNQYGVPLAYMGGALNVWGEEGGRHDDERPDGIPRDDAGSSDLKNSNTMTAVKTEAEDGGVDNDDDKVDHRKRKRNRTIRSCVPCHNHKRKCDRKRPCGRCTALGLTGSCVYEVDEARDPNDPDVIETDRLRRRIAELEQVVRELRQRHPPRGQAAATAATAATTLQNTPSASSDAEKRRVLVDRYARFKIGEAAALVGEGGVRAPSLQSDSSPVASDPSRDHYSEPYNPHALPTDEMVADSAGRKTFLGTPAGKPMLRRLREIVHGRSKVSNDEIMTIPEDLAFTGWFASARKTFPFTTIWSHDNFIDEIVGLLPNKEDSEQLLVSFYEEIGLLFEAWHVPTLMAEFRHFFSLSAAEKRTQPLSNLALYIMICSLGCMVRAANTEIMSDAQKNAESKDLTSSRLQSELYLSAAYQALRLCSFLSSPTVATVQAQVCINVYLLHSERAADGWALTGSLVRQCIAMGLHVEPTHLDPKISMRDAEIRRRLWWSVAGLDALLCVSFGRPTCINYYTCHIPQDRADDTLSDEPGSAMAEPPSNALGPAATEQTYHAAYFQLTLPSLELLNRTFHVSPIVARNTFMGWFTPANVEETIQPPTVVGNTYEDAIRLGRDVFDWYNHVPYGMRFDDDMPVEELQKRSRREINQTLALCVKTLILVLILHRPYLRGDPSAYPESSRLCGDAAHRILRAYSAMVKTKSSIAWSWWTMSYRAFHAATVCAFLAIREPSTPLAERCLVDLRGAITIFEDRTADWMVSHPVQSDLCGGLVRLEKLAHAAVQQYSPLRPHDHMHQRSPMPVFPGLASDPSIPIFPTGLTPVGDHTGGLGDFMYSRNNSPSHGMDDARRPSGPFLQPWMVPQSEANGHTLFAGSTDPHHQLPQLGIGANGKEEGGGAQPDLVSIWASMFNIKMDADGGADLANSTGPGPEHQVHPPS